MDQWRIAPTGVILKDDDSVGWRGLTNGIARILLIHNGWGHDVLGTAAMKHHSSRTTISPIRRQATDALRRARKLPRGPERDDLRQLGLGLLWLEKRGFVATWEYPVAFTRANIRCRPFSQP